MRVYWALASVLVLMVLATVAVGVLRSPDVVQPAVYGHSGGGVSNPSQQRAVWGGFFSPGNDPTNTDPTDYAQLELGLVEYFDSLANYIVNPTGDLVCNTSATDLDAALLLLTTSMQHVDTQTRNFQVVYGTCMGCSGDAFPQLISADAIAATTIPISFHNNIDTQPVPLVAVKVSLQPTECLGLMVRGDNNRDVLVGLGTLTIVAGDVDGFSAQNTWANLLDTEDTDFLGLSGYVPIVQPGETTLRLLPLPTFHYSDGTLDGAGNAVEAHDDDWHPLDPGIVVDHTHGDGLTISANAEQWCNFTDEELRGFLSVRVQMTQANDNLQTLRLRFCEVTGEVACTSGDVMSGPEDQAVFKDDEETRPHMMVSTSGSWLDGECRGLMVRRLDGDDEDYEVMAGNYFAEFRDILLP